MRKEFENILRQIAEERGKEFLNNTSLCRAILNDYCKGQYKKEINVLVGAIEGRYKDKLAAIKEELLSVQLPILAEHFHDEYGYSKELCLWSLELIGNIFKGNSLGNNFKFKKIKYSNGDIYEGEFLGDLRHGKGKFIWPNGDIYEGDYIKDIQSGIGKFTWSSGDTYEGDWLDGTRTGKGKLTWSDGDIYEGDFVEGQITGKGKLIWSSGDTYEGDFLDNKMTGYGKKTYIDGKVEEGYWENGVLVKKKSFFEKLMDKL